MDLPYTSLHQIGLKEANDRFGYRRTRKLEEYSKGALNCIRVFFSVTIFLMSMSTGLFSSINAPSIPDLQIRYDATVEQISSATGIKNIGYLVGSLFGGLANDRFLDRSGILMGVAMILPGAATLFIPWGQVLWVLGVLSFVQGIGHGLSAPASIATVTSLWGKRSATPLHCCLYGYPVGMVIAPLICAPFISEKKIWMADVNITTVASITLATTIGTIPLAPIENHYMITGFYSLCVGVVFFILYYITPRALLMANKKQKKSIKEMFDPRSCIQGNAAYGIVLLTLFSMYVTFSTAISRTSQLFYTYLITSELGFTSNEAVLFMFATNIAMMASRALAMLVLLKAPIQVVTFVEVFGNLVAVIGIVVWGTQKKTLLWIFSIASYIFHGPMYPGQYAWIDRYIVLYSVVVSVAAMGMGLTGYFFEWFNGFLFDNVSRDGILYSRLGCSVMCAVLIIIMQILASSHGERERQATNVVVLENKEKENKS